jgi:hypothetical protein
VAIFAIRPGGGLTLIYPRLGYGGRELFGSGAHHVRTVGPPYRFSGLRTSHHRPSWSGRSPIYVLLLAAERPLEIDDFRFDGTAPWALGLAYSFSPWTAARSLARRIVPRPESTEWTSAMHVIWPEPVHDPLRPRPRFITVQCGNGVVLTVPVEAVVMGVVRCPEPARPPSDSAGPRKAKPRVTDSIPARPLPRPITRPAGPKAGDGAGEEAAPRRPQGTRTGVGLPITRKDPPGSGEPSGKGGRAGPAAKPHPGSPAARPDPVKGPADPPPKPKKPSGGGPGG